MAEYFRIGPRSELDKALNVLAREILRRVEQGSFELVVRCEHDDAGEWAHLTIGGQRFEIPMGSTPSRDDWADFEP